MAGRPLSQEEQKVLELTQLAGLEIREDIFIILWELMQLDAPPMLVLQLLRQMAGISSEDVPSSSASFKFQDGGRTLPGRSN